MIPWKQTTPRPPTPAKATITIGPCELSIRENHGDAGNQWQWMMFSLGEFSDAPLGECLETWPKRAVQLAHQAVSELQHKLQELDK